jgi:hypothetical protein
VNRPPPRLLGHLRSIGSVFLLLMFDGSGAAAEPARGAERVILLQPTTASPAMRRSLARIRDELSADRFQVVLTDSSTTDDPGAVIESAGRDTDHETTLALFGDPATGQAELCVVQRAARRAAVRQTTVVVDDPERMPEALATRALELLRATALELSIAIDRAPRPRESPERHLEAANPPRPSPRAPAPEAPVVLVDMGLGVWKSVDGPPPAVTPVGRVALRLSERIQARVSVAGLGSRPDIQTAYGSATISQTIALLEFAAVPRLDKRVHMTLSFGAGVLNVAVAGTGAAPYEGRSAQQWSAAFDGGAGVALAVASHVALVSELHALLASPHPVVRFVDSRATTVGYPTLMFTLTLQVAL